MSFQTVATIIADTINCKVEDITPDTNLEALGLTSLDTITVLFDLEEAFDVVIPNEIIPTITTVNDILEKLDEANIKSEVS
jgi:acyl carrier protein